MKIIFNISFIIFLFIIYPVKHLQAQTIDLDSLYISKPSDSERDKIIDSFNITLTDGSESYAKWSLYDPYYFNPNDTLPSIYSLINSLRVIREQKFSEPLPWTTNAYEYMLSHFQNGGIELSLRTGYNYGGGDRIYLNANAAFWDGRTSNDPFTPFQNFQIWPYIYKVQLLLHETRHSDPDDPGHDTNVAGKDTRFSDEGAYARDAIYYMWIYKYGINNNQSFKNEAKFEATWILNHRFVEMPPTHPNPLVQQIIDELLGTTGIQQTSFPAKLYLYQNYPNPFNPSTIIKYELPRQSLVTLKIYDVLGREVAVLVNEQKPAGRYEFKFDGKNLSSGIYFYRIKAGDFVQTKKMILLK